MVAVEIAMIVIGVVLMVGSFFVIEKLSPKEIQKIAEISDEEIKKIVEKGMESAQTQVDDKVDQLVDESVERVEVSLDRLTNEKIMAVDEFSQTVLEKINMNHDEVMFLYSMLNDKHSELTGFANDLQNDLREMKEEKNNLEFMKASVDTTMQEITQHDKEETEPAEEAVEEETPQAPINHNDEIIRLYEQGMDVVQIAKELGIGQGEVKLVVDLEQLLKQTTQE